MFRILRRALLVLVGVAAVTALIDAATYDARAWQADYGRLKQGMAQGYANLDWIAAHRRLDLVALDRRTTRAIDHAHSRVRAFLAMRRFVKAFRDPHFRLVVGQRPVAPELDVADAAGALSEPALASGAPPAPAAVDAPAGKDCAAAGYGEADHALHFPFERMAGWKPLQGGDFPAGLVGDLGVLRIAQFGEDRYLSACEQVFHAGIGQRELKLAVRAVQQKRLVATLEALQARGARRLLVDVSGNGGGTEWVADVIALMTDRPMTRLAPRLVAPACDRSRVWQGAPPPCEVFGLEGERAALQGVGPWTGPLLILADRGTGSAAEDFVAWLQQNKLARVIGEPTAGAGCGYVNGGTRTQFRASPFDARMPNCARLLEDGTNEIEGIPPDVPIPMHEADAARQAAALAAVIGRGV